MMCLEDTTVKQPQVIMTMYAEQAPRASETISPAHSVQSLKPEWLERWSLHQRATSDTALALHKMVVTARS